MRPTRAPTTESPENNTSESSNQTPRKKPQKLGGGGGQSQQQQQLQRQPQPDYYSDEDDFNQVPEPVVMPRRQGGRRMVPVHQSRIADRPVKVGEKDSSLKIKIELDLEVEVEIYARVKGDVTIGLM
jgi:hypothetical protein